MDKVTLRQSTRTRIGAFRFPSCNPVDLVISKSDSPDPVTAGEQLNYTVRVRNDGSEQATNVVVSDELPTGVDFLDNSHIKWGTVAHCEKTSAQV